MKVSTLCFAYVLLKIQTMTVSGQTNTVSEEYIKAFVHQEIASLNETMFKEIRQLRAENKELWATIRQTVKGRRSLSSRLTRCPNGFVSHDLSCYKASNLIASWAEAMVYCDAYGGRLARIESDTEYNFINAYLKNADASIQAHYYWMDGLDALVEGEWIWAKTLEPISYSKWIPGEPDSSTTTSNCMALSGVGHYLFDDGGCENRHPFVCEIRLDVESGQIVG